MNRAAARGYSLVEMVVVVSILAIVAAIAVPTRSSQTEQELRIAASEFAAAIRFARNESMRTGEPHGFRFLTNQYRIRVFTADTAVNPWTWVWDVYHPVNKQLYDYTFPTDLSEVSTPVVHVPVFKETCNRPGVVYFDATGAPWCLEPETVLLESYRLDLFAGSEQRSVVLDGLTGRVTIQ